AAVRTKRLGSPEAVGESALRGYLARYCGTSPQLGRHRPLTGTYECRDTHYFRRSDLSGAQDRSECRKWDLIRRGLRGRSSSRPSLGPESAGPRTQTADHRRESRLTPQLGPWAERAQHALEGRHLRRTAGDRHNIHVGRLQPRRVERPPADRGQLLELWTDRRFEL